MPPAGEGRSTPGNVGEKDVQRKPPRQRIPRRTIERIHPDNLEFERQVAAVEARQEQQRQNQISAIMGSLSFGVYWPYLSILSDDHMEDIDSEITWNDVFALPGQSAPLLLQDGTQRGKGQLLKDSTKPDDNDFLEDAFLKINSDKQKNTGNKKNSKNKKKKKGKGKGKKQSNASEMQSKPPTEPSSTCADATGGEALASSSRHVVADAPLLEYSSSSSSSRVTEVITVVVSGASSGNEKDRPSSSTDEFKTFDSTASYATAASSAVNDNTGGKAWNTTRGDHVAGCSSNVRIEPSLPVSETTDSPGIDKTSGEGDKPNDDQSCSSAIAPAGGSQEEGSLCGDYASNDGDFQKVISRKAAQKMKRMQRLESVTPSPTMAASVPNMTSALVLRASHREVLTIGHYIKDKYFHGGKPNHGKGKYQKGSSSSNMSKTGYNGGENVSGSSRILVAITMHQGKPASTRSQGSTSRHQVTLETIDETSPPECLPVKGKQKAKAPVGDTKDTYSTTPSFDRTSSVGHLDISSCVDNKEEQKKEENRQAFSTHASSELDKIVKAANDAYKIQAASAVLYMDGGIHADIETFIHSATPVIGHISCRRSNISLQDQCLWSVWSWYEEPECFGIDVKRQGSISSSWPQLSTYFLPSLSAVQLFGHFEKSGNKLGTLEEPSLLSPDHGELCFEYFESENPFSRPPLFTKIKQLLDGLPGNPIFGDPKQLKSVKLSDLHPASWFCVAWYPISQIPEAAGKCESAFLTYHCPGKLAQQTSSTNMADGLDHIVCPIVGLMGYKEQKWLQLGGQSWSKSRLNNLFNQRLMTLRCTASVMSKAVVPRPSREAIMNYHSDYVFFSSRSKY